MTVVFEVNKSISYVTHSKSVYAPHKVDKKYNIPPSTVFKDNDACLKFAQLPCLTSRTKHIGIPYHWFREQVESLQVQLERSNTKNQLADQFTKGLSGTSFQDARKPLVGW
jgi:hypothetical protein